MTQLNIIAGDDYLAAESRAVVFTEPSNTAWPHALASQTVVMTVRDANNNVVFTVTGTVTDAGTDATPASVSFDITHANTNKLGVGNVYTYKVVATDISSDVVTLVRDSITVS